MNVVLDADVLIGALDASDVHHRQARSMFRRWQRQQATTLISVVNYSEVLVAPAADRLLLRAARATIAALGVTIHQPTEAIGVDAARLRARHPISLSDAFCIATARHTAGAIASLDLKLVRAATTEQVATTR